MTIAAHETVQPSLRFDLSRTSADDFRRVCFGEDAPAVADDALRQSRQVFEGIKLRLASEQQRPAGVERNRRRAINHLGVRETGVPGTCQLPVQEIRRLIRSIEKIAIHAFEIAVDALVANDALDGVDARGMSSQRSRGPGRQLDPLPVAKVRSGTFAARGACS
jgi:hypothetical protein